MMSKIWLINIALAICIAFMGMNAWQVWTGEVPEQNVAAKTEVPAEASVQNAQPEKQKAPESEYNLIAEKNLFDPDRKEAKPEEGSAAAASDEKKPDAPRQDIALHGVILMKDYQKALIRTADTGSGKDRWVTVGETVGTMTVSAIEKNRIVLTEGDEIRDISLHEGKNRGAGSQNLAKNDAPNLINVSASAEDAPKVNPAETPKTETKPAPADPNAGKVAESQTNAPNPVFGGIDRQGGESKPASAGNTNPDPVFGGGGKRSGEGNTQEKPQGNNNSNAEENKMINPFLQLLQRKN
ncbi:MAG: type II secretion system protein N [Desulfobacterales bacterium]